MSHDLNLESHNLNLEPQQEKSKSRDGTVIKTRIKMRQEKKELKLKFSDQDEHKLERNPETKSKLLTNKWTRLIRTQILIRKKDRQTKSRTAIKIRSR